jgi:hypothetical protein
MACVNHCNRALIALQSHGNLLVQQPAVVAGRSGTSRPHREAQQRRHFVATR